MSVIKALLQKAVEADASDIHMTVDRGPILRVHSQLRDSGFDALTAKHLEEIVADILPPYMHEEYHSTHEADFSLAEEGVGRFRVNIFNAQSIPAIAMRHVKAEIPTFEQLGLPLHLKELATWQRGVIILSGTTGSGKSTTLAAIIGEINRSERRRIITIEDPVEYIFEDDQCVITQRELGLDTLSFDNALTHVMRQDPDIILVGEMRDRESISTALLAAETGHLVLSTLHSGTSNIAIPRVLDMFPADEQDQIRMSFAETDFAIICQRLIPAVGGSVVPAVEIMINTSTVRKLLEKNQIDILSAAIETGREDGMQSFNQSIYDHVKSGKITEADGMRFATNAESLRMNLKGIFLDESSRILASV